MNRSSSSGPANLLDNRPLVFTLLLVFDSLHLIWAGLMRSFEMNSVTAGFWVIGLATVEMGIFLAWTGKLRWSVLWNHIWFFIVVGALVGGATWMSYESVRWVDPGTASLLTRASTLFSLLLGLFWLGDRLNRREWIGIAVAISGIVVISFQPGDYLRLGSLIVLGSSFTYALHAAVVKRYGDGIEFWNFFFFRVLFTSLAMLMLMFSSGQPAFPESGWAWGAVLLAGTVDVVISRTLYYWALRKVTMSYHTIILMLSPVVTILFALLFFREFPTVRALIGGAIIIFGLVIVNWHRLSKRREILTPSS